MTRVIEQERIGRMRLKCRTQWHIIVAFLWQHGDWLPTHALQGIDTAYGFIGSSGEQRVRELAVDSPRCPLELHGKVAKVRGSKIGKKGKEASYEFFRWQSHRLYSSADRLRMFDEYPCQRVAPQVCNTH